MIKQWRQRSLGVRVSAGLAESFGVETWKEDNGKQVKWVASCDTHGVCIGERTKRQAIQTARTPWNFCYECQKIVDLNETLKLGAAK